MGDRTDCSADTSGSINEYYQTHVHAQRLVYSSLLLYGGTCVCNRRGLTLVVESLCVQFWRCDQFLYMQVCAWGRGERDRGGVGVVVGGVWGGGGGG